MTVRIHVSKACIILCFFLSHPHKGTQAAVLFPRVIIQGLDTVIHEWTPPMPEY